MRSRILTYEEALSKAAGLCAKSEQCSSDILKKLSAWGLTFADSERIIRRLEELRFLDDERFARAYAHDKLLFSGWGKLKIAQGLWVKRIPRPIIDTAIAEIDPAEYVDVARKVLKSKLRLSPDLLETYEGRTKLLRFGAGRGFGLDLLSRIINEIRKEAEYEEDD